VSWESSALEVPDRWDQSGRSGPRAAKATAATVTGGPQQGGGPLPGCEDPARGAPPDEGGQDGRTAQGLQGQDGREGVSVPDPRAWKRAIGQHGYASQWTNRHDW